MVRRISIRKPKRRHPVRRLALESLEPRRLFHAPGSPVVELESAHGVITAGGLVSQWNDQSGFGNHVVAVGTEQPAFNPAITTPSNAPAIRFDGVNDRLVRTISDGVAGLSGLPPGNADRSLFIVARFYDAAAWGGVAYGDAASNQTFGVGVVGPGNSEGRFVLQGFGAGNDLVSTTSGYSAATQTAGQWTILAAVLSDGTATLYANGSVIASWTHNYDTDLTNLALLSGIASSRLVIGEEIGEAGHIQLDLATVLVYPTAASESFRMEVETYLTAEYLAADLMPDAVDDSVAVDANTSFVIPKAALLANDLLGNIPTSITFFDAISAQNGTIDQSPTALTYTPAPGFVGIDTFTYSITDADGDIDTATVTLNVTIASPASFVDEVVLSNLNAPLALQTLPDGRILLLEKAGSIKIFDPAAEIPVAQPYLTVPNVQSGQERGLTDITLDPDFATNGYFYVYYAHAETINSLAMARVRLSRFTHSEAGGTPHADPSSEFVVWEDPQAVNLTQFCCHYGGGLDFGPDDKLYLTIGDKWRRPANSQDLTNAGGKILRLNPDGTIPTDNPVFGNPNSLPGIWAYGLRNPFRARWDIETDRFFIGDVGGNDQLTAREELNLGVAGANYGWNQVEGVIGNPLLTDPIFDYGHQGATPLGGAIAGGLVYRGAQYPAEFNGAYFFGDYVGGWIHYLKFDPITGAVIDADPATPQLDAFEFSDAPIAPVAFEVGPEGAIYYADFFTGQVHRIVYNSGNLAPTIVTATGTPTVAQSAPLVVNFSGSATDPDDDSLTYTWIFGDGTQGTGANVSHSYAAVGQYAATLRVSDGTNTTVSAPIVITVGSAPVIQSISPIDGTTFRAGDLVNLSAVVLDDGPLGNSNYSWTVRFIHNGHTHPEFDGISGTTVPFDILTTGHDFSDSTGFEIELTVTDQDGISATDVVRIFPEKVNLDFNTNFPGLITYDVDGINRTGNFTLDSAINFEHVIIVPPTLLQSGLQYNFVRWSTGSTEPTLLLTTPDVNATITAEYTAVGAPPLVTQSLVLRLDAEAGVTTSTGTTVASWIDQTGRGNDLFASGDPELLTAALNGYDVIRLDGSGDKLQGIASLAGGLPGGASNRSIFVVARYDGGGYGGFTYGAPSLNRTFGPSVSPTGNLSAQGWGAVNDFDSGVSGDGAGWLVQELVLNSNQLTHYKDGAVIDSRSHSYNTLVGTGSAIVLGAEIDGNPFVNMSVAEVLVYDTALDANDRQQVEAYLFAKYFSNNSRPVAGDDTGLGFVTNANFTFTTASVLANDSDADSDPLKIISLDTTGTLGLVQQLTNGTFRYDPNGQFGGVPIGQTATDSFTYTISDNQGGVTAATVTITINGDNPADISKLQTGVVRATTENWTTVTLDKSYIDKVVVATLVTDRNNPSVVARIRESDQANTFQILLQRTGTFGGSAAVTLDVHYLVVEAGVYNIDGVKFEAIKVDSTQTDRKGSYVGQNAFGSLTNAYNAPVVVGQVMSFNDPNWSAFWSSGNIATDPAIASQLRVGRHVGSATIPPGNHLSEVLGVVVFEAGTGIIGTQRYSADLGADAIDGVNQSGDSYPLTLPNPSAAIATQSGMDGDDGGWAVLHGTSPTNDFLRLAIDEDQFDDSERSHTNEQVSYILFAPAIGGVVDPSDLNTGALDYDVDANGSITLKDALRVINAISFERRSTEGESPPQFGFNTDVNRDGKTTLRDALLVINQIARMSRAPVIDQLLADGEDDDRDKALETVLDWMIDEPMTIVAR